MSSTIPSLFSAAEAEARFNAPVERNWQWRFNDHLEDASLAAIERRHGEAKAFLAELDAIPRDALTAGDRTDAEISSARSWSRPSTRSGSPSRS